MDSWPVSWDGTGFSTHSTRSQFDFGTLVTSAVSDLTHLFAELVENATSFSSPDTTVLVHGEPVGNGFVVEIEDRGLGMRPDPMAEAHRLISNAHQRELFDQVATALDLDPATPVVLCDARDRASAKEVLIAVVEHASRTHATRRARYPLPDR